MWDNTLEESDSQSDNDEDVNDLRWTTAWAPQFSLADTNFIYSYFNNGISCFISFWINKHDRGNVDLFISINFVVYIVAIVI